MKTRFLAALAVFASASSADAQSMTPMRGEVTSFTDEFAIRVFPSNPYKRRIDVAVRVYDANFKPVAARISPPEMSLGGGASRGVLVVVGFEGQAERRVRVCTESIPFPGTKMSVRTQVCGRFIARHRLLR
ncbi:hypothetical protein [Nitratireductor soli]|uniref:hypothetical protein n=1 Tax=Nitratireductor soli TaxID=1670619 RepID=UPI0009E5671C|nr:hypothetical protein [Nitratireductor soli]